MENSTPPDHPQKGRKKRENKRKQRQQTSRCEITLKILVFTLKINGLNLSRPIQSTRGQWLPRWRAGDGPCPPSPEAPVDVPLQSRRGRVGCEANPTRLHTRNPLCTRKQREPMNGRRGHPVQRQARGSWCGCAGLTVELRTAHTAADEKDIFK